MNAHSSQKELKRPSRKWVWIVCVLLSVVGGFLLIGIPGAILVGAADWLLQITGMGAAQLSGDNIWPIVIMISLLWPFLMLPVSTWVHLQIPKLHSGLHWLSIILVSLIITVLCIYVWIGIQVA